MKPTHLLQYGEQFFLADMRSMTPKLPALFLETAYIYCYPDRGYCGYSVADLGWAEYCGFGRWLRLEITQGVGCPAIPQVPCGWCLPYDWRHNHNRLSLGPDWLSKVAPFRPVFNISF